MCRTVRRSCLPARAHSSLTQVSLKCVCVHAGVGQSLFDTPSGFYCLNSFDSDYKKEAKELYKNKSLPELNQLAQLARDWNSSQGAQVSSPASPPPGDAFHASHAAQVSSPASPPPAPASHAAPASDDGGGKGLFASDGVRRRSERNKNKKRNYAESDQESDHESDPKRASPSPAPAVATPTQPTPAVAVAPAVAPAPAVPAYNLPAPAATELDSDLDMLLGTGTGGCLVCAGLVFLGVSSDLLGVPDPCAEEFNVDKCNEVLNQPLDLHSLSSECTQGVEAIEGDEGVELTPACVFSLQMSLRMAVTSLCYVNLAQQSRSV